jgi:hypothetical protein
MPIKSLKKNSIIIIIFWPFAFKRKGNLSSTLLETVSSFIIYYQYSLKEEKEKDSKNKKVVKIVFGMMNSRGRIVILGLASRLI